MNISEIEDRFNRVDEGLDKILTSAASSRFTPILVGVVAFAFLWLGWFIRGL